MTYADDLPRIDQPTAELGAWDQCDHCQAPLDVRQRYCVVCGARRTHADDPAARWLASARRARLSEQSAAATPAAGGGPVRIGGIALAAAFALLPIAAGIGVVAGRGSGDDAHLLVEALKAQKAPVVTVVGGAAGSGGGTAANDDGGGDGGGADKSSTKTSRARTTSDGNEVLSSGRYGEARRLTGARVTDKTREESKRALDKIVNSKGREYVDSQRGLPDQIVIP